MVLSDDALQLARHRPSIELATGWSCLPYLFGVAIYCFEARNSSGNVTLCNVTCFASAQNLIDAPEPSERTNSCMDLRPGVFQTRKLYCWCRASA